MDLNAVKERAEKKGFDKKTPLPFRHPIPIASTDRPYDSPPLPQKNLLSIPFQKDAQTKPLPTKTEDKVETKLGQKLGQTEGKSDTNLGQSKDELRTDFINNSSNLGQIEDKVETKLRTQPRTKLGQSRDKRAASNTFSSLIGLQRAIVLLIYEQCQLSRDHLTKPLSIEHITISCKTTRFSARKTIQRLENKGIIIRHSYKDGRSGWTQYGLPENIFHEIFITENKTPIRRNLGQSEDKVETQLETELRTTSYSSSNIYNNITTTNIANQSEWSKIDLSIYRLTGFGETQRDQLMLLSQEKPSLLITPERVKKSLDRFKFGIEKGKAQPLSVFMGVMRKGQDWHSEGYRDLEEEAIEQQVKLANEARLKKQQNGMIVWESKLTEEERGVIRRQIPTHLVLDFDNRLIDRSALNVWLIHYYLENVLLKRST